MNQPTDWHWREYILTITHRWHWIVAVFLLGALLGWGASRLTSPRYRASLDLYVGIDVYRAPRDRYIVGVAQDTFENLDDYKNWNMEQLNALAVQDDFLLDTLEQLQAQGQDWRDVNLADLRAMLRGSWRNAGRWRLTAEASSPTMAAQAVTAWAQVIDQRVNAALVQSRQVVALDIRMVALADRLAEKALRAQVVEALIPALQRAERAWQEGNPGSYDRDRLLGLVARAADWGAGWSALLEAFPPPAAKAEAYVDWIRRAQGAVAAEAEALPGEIGALEAEYDALATQYARAAEASLALSANLSLDHSEQVAPAVEDVRPAGTFMLVGGALALLAWLFVELVRAARDD